MQSPNATVHPSPTLCLTGQTRAAAATAAAGRRYALMGTAGRCMVTGVLGGELPAAAAATGEPRLPPMVVAGRCGMVERWAGAASSAACAVGALPAAAASALRSAMR